MANAVTASTSDVNSGYWNFRANAFRRPSIVFDARYFANIAHDYIAMQVPLT
jgi:hypothetical protein